VTEERSRAIAGWLLVAWVAAVYAAYFRQFDFYVAYAVGVARRVMPFVALQL
jgi:hypothetical protein